MKMMKKMKKMKMMKVDNYQSKTYENKIEKYPLYISYKYICKIINKLFYHNNRRNKYVSIVQLIF